MTFLKWLSSVVGVLDGAAAVSKHLLYKLNLETTGCHFCLCMF